MTVKSQECAYLKQIKHIVNSSEPNYDEEYATDCDEAEQLWKSEIIELFKIMKNVTSKSKVNIEKSSLTKQLQNFSDEEATDFFTNKNVAISKMIEWISIIFKERNKQLYAYYLNCNRILHTYDNQKKQNQIVISDDNILKNETQEKNRCLCNWALGALLHLDKIVAMLEDVAYSLQVIRRCCRWRRLTYKYCDSQFVIHEHKCIECIIENYFEQR